ncbi:hypothetical protein HW555_014433 [Spodoptera exigua]|uniref:tRNA(Ile)-lysidine synthetase n=1 Tax=Spodoptera exigua TaxID=7107 RepID=A0A835G3J0_SPOEX|nr:hypothetical protein HW555_014433 [Spodoptera exigua]
MQTAAKKDQLNLAVAHVNHQLREESIVEAEYLKSYCQEQKLPYYYKEWTAIDKTTNIEARARKFRYDFFAETMNKEEYSSLFTAHHGDDQAETILMKLTRGSSLKNLVGIKDRQPFASGDLIRPFLIFSKERLEKYAKQRRIMYFEDHSNQSDKYVRNRLRHQVVPVLKKENPQFLQHIADFSEQIHLADDIIQSVITPKYNGWVTKTKTGWAIQLLELKAERRSIQTFFLTTLFQKTLIPEGITINQAQIQQFLIILNQSAPQLTMDLENGWQIIKEYDVAYLTKKQSDQKEQEFYLYVNEQIFLSESEWLGLESSKNKLEQPDVVKNWQEFSLLITAETSLPLIVRHRKAGDRISLTPDLTKRLNRLFIDQKIPNLQREQAWVILSSDNNIIWVPQFAYSHLSIPKETDKILYRLLYKIKM